MNIGKLVREKMKLHRTDCSGEYVDNTGKHFTMKLAGEGYTVSYGGDKMREVDISKEQGLKLAGNCRKLELVDGEKKLAKRTEAFSENGVSCKIIYDDVKQEYYIQIGNKPLDGPYDTRKDCMDVIEAACM